MNDVAAVSTTALLCKPCIWRPGGSPRIDRGSSSGRPITVASGALGTWGVDLVPSRRFCRSGLYRSTVLRLSARNESESAHCPEPSRHG